jgi:FAD synthase
LDRDVLEAGRFESVDDLVAQMNRDVDDAKRIAESASYG